MSKDTDRLAADMQNMKPSKASRENAVDAAMAAFDMEFAAEPGFVPAGSDLRDETVGASSQDEIISEVSQGLAAAPRLTEQSTGMTPLRTLGRFTMSAFDKIFSFVPKNTMMAGSCMAALIAALVIVPSFDFGADPFSPKGGEAVTDTGEAAPQPVPEIKSTPPVDAAPSQPAPAQAETPVPADTQNVTATPEPKIVPTPQVKVGANAAPSQMPSPVQEAQRGGILSISDLLSKTRSDDSGTEIDTRTREYRAEQQQRDNAQLLAAQQNAAAAAQKKDKSEVVVTSGKRQSSLVPAVNRRVKPRPVNVQAGRKNTSASTPLPGGYTLEEVPAEYKTETKEVVVHEASTELIQIPATYETVSETVVVQPQSSELVVVPAEYEWVYGDVEGSSVEYAVRPAEYETVTEAVVVQEASTELVTIPTVYETVVETVVVTSERRAADGSTIPAVTQDVARRVVKTPASTQERVIPSVTKMETRRVVKTPAATVERVVPYEKRDGRTRVPVKPAHVTERAIPAVTKQVTRRVIKTPASVRERVIPGGNIQEVSVTTKVSEQTFYLRDESGKIVREFESRDAFEEYTRNIVTVVAEKPVSTFSIDVDTASYSFLRASLRRGQLPPPSAIRLEEMVNYFPYDYTAPESADEPFRANVTVTPTPWNADTKLMHIGIKGYVPPAAERPSSNIVFLMDTSGSMNNTNKLPLLINSFKLLLNTLDGDDTVSIVTYAGRAGTVLEPTPASDKTAITAALTRLRAGGSTAGAAGLELAYQKAQENFDDEGVNRVILATDGDFNVGFSSPADMKTYIAKKRETGIFLSVLGFGMGNYNDHLMQSLAQNGNGVASYIDSLDEANKVLADEAGSALYTIAKDVKIQVEFNPETISEYRLLGYETRALKREDFNNDKVDAGEIGAGHTVTAIYELTPIGSPARSVDALRYASSDVKTTGSDEFAFVKIRHKLPSADKSTLQTFPVGPKLERKLKRAGDDMQFATAVVAAGQKLRGDSHLADFSYDDVIKLAKKGKGKDKRGYRAEFIELMRLAQNLND